MNIYVKVVRGKEWEAVRAIAEKPNNFYCGSMRGFLNGDDPLEELWLDTRYDEDMRAAGLID